MNIVNFLNINKFKTYIIVKEVKKEAYIKSVYFSIRENNFIKQAKTISAKIIKCELVDGLSIFDGKSYLCGAYCDDMAFLKPLNFKINKQEARGTVVFINEFRKISKKECEKMLKIVLNKIT